MALARHSVQVEGTGNDTSDVAEKQNQIMKGLMKTNRNFVFRFSPSVRIPLRLLLLTLLLGLSPRFGAFAQGTLTITDLEETPITGVIANSVLLNNGDIMAPTNDPEKLTFSLASDGTVATLGRGIAVLTNAAGTISDILDVTTSSGARNGGVKYVQAAGTFTSDGDPGGLSLALLNLDAAVLEKIMGNALLEDGTQQNLGTRLINIDTSPGDRLVILSIITAASDVELIPEPSSLALVGVSLLALAVNSRRRRVGERRPKAGLVF